MIDLDDVLRTASTGTDWDATAAQRVADQVAKAHGGTTEWEPGDEEWIRVSTGAGAGMVHVRYPLTLATPALAEAFRRAEPNLRVAEITGMYAEDLRASADLLRATVLPYTPWGEDFDTEHFSAWDLFVESV